MISCRGCGENRLDVVLSLGEQPLANRFLTADELTRPEPRYPLELAVCRGCSLAQITEVVPPEELFLDYPYFSSYSETVLASAEALVRRMVRKGGLGPHSLAMEVASNDGYLLQHYVRAGVPVLGIDPARNVVPAALARGVPTVATFFGEDLAEELRASGRRADVLHANNVLAHVPDIGGFLRGLSRILTGDGVAVIETPYLLDLVERLEFDTIYHEHLHYYSLTALDALLRRWGLAVVDVERTALHGGSLRVFAVPIGAARPMPTVTSLLEEEAVSGIGTADFFAGFAERVRRACTALAALLTDLKRQGARIAAYGAAAKGTVLLNTAGITAETVDFVADRSPHKQGRYMPGVHIPIVPPGRLMDEMPEFVLLLAWNFADEIVSQQARYRDAGGRFILPVGPHVS